MKFDTSIFRGILFGFWLVLHILGFMFTSYGLLRESFSSLAEKRVFGEGRFGEGSFGGGLTPIQKLMVDIGLKTGLLPDDQTQTLTDRKRNAAWAITGVVLIGFSIIFDLALKYVDRE